MSIWITGDTHGYYDSFMRRIAENGVNEGDTIIVTGDFGFIWRHPEMRAAFFKLRKENYTFLFVDGNHEDFELLYEYPLSDYCGGKAQIIEPNIVHLLRGEYYTIKDKNEDTTISIFTFGGAYSHDRAMRQLGYSWFKEELPSEEEYLHGDDTLAAHDYKVDYIFSHTGPYSILRAMNFNIADEEMQLNSYLDKIKDIVDFKSWFYGHYHQNKSILKYTCLLDDMIKLE